MLRNRQQTFIIYCAKQNCAPYYAAKTGFLVRKEMVRKEVRSESLYFLANRASANSGANSKIVVNSLLVTSEMILSKLQLSSELSRKMMVDSVWLTAWLTAKCWLTGFS